MSVSSRFKAVRPTSPPKLFLIAVISAAATLGIGSVSFVPTSTSAAIKDSSSKFLIPCFHKKTGRYTAEVEPENCDLAGPRNGKAFVEVPVTGIRWSKWGSFRSRGSHGKTTAFSDSPRPGGIGVRVIAYRRVSCGGGRVSYSWVNVFYPGNGLNIEIKLPSCNAPSVSG
jgi:hypothetical protein